MNLTRKAIGGRILAAAKKDTILTVSLVCAVFSMFLVPPSAAYIGYVDFRVLALLFCLMVVVAGFQECGLFVLMARKLLSGENNFRQLSWMLVMLPFFCSMLITNDVALLTFVPFTILILDMIGEKKYMAWIVVLQTVAANLGSMATPVGNPQNLFLYGRFSIPAGSFFAVLLPLTALSFLLLTAAVFCIPRIPMQIRFDAPAAAPEKNVHPALFLFLFLLCLLSVFRVLDYRIVLAVTVVCLLLFDRKLFRTADYLLLLTFVCFFLFAGNMGRLDWLKRFMAEILNRNPVLFSALTSQFISNVPAAVLLSGFTNDWKPLLLGTNLGGLGTPIASLASLISLKFYIKELSDKVSHYLAVFTAVNIAFFIILYAAASFL